MRCPHCNTFTKTNTGWKVHFALSQKCRKIRAQKANAQAEDANSDKESLSSSSSSSSSDSSNSPLLPSRNPLFKFLRRNRRGRLPDRRSDGSGSRSSFDSADSITSSTDPPIEPFVEFHPTAADTYGRGKTTLDDVCDSDQFAEQRKGNMFHPFVSEEDWGVAAWLIESGLSMGEIDKFLKLTFVSSILRCFAAYDSLTNLCCFACSGSFTRKAIIFDGAATPREDCTAPKAPCLEGSNCDCRRRDN